MEIKKPNPAKGKAINKGGIEMFKLVPYIENPVLFPDFTKKAIEEQYNDIHNHSIATKYDSVKNSKQEALHQLNLVMIKLGYNFAEIKKPNPAKG